MIWRLLCTATIVVAAFIFGTGLNAIGVGRAFLKEAAIEQ